MNKKLPAFTIMEVTVAMLLTAMVIAITYTCYTIIHQGYIGFKIRQQGLVNISQLDQVLNRDAENAELISHVPDGIMVGRVRYTLLPDKVIRNTLVADTFLIGTRDIERSFEGTPVTQDDRIDEVRFVMLSGSEAYIFHFHKHYSAQQLFNDPSHGQN